MPGESEQVTVSNPTVVDQALHELWHAEQAPELDPSTTLAVDRPSAGENLINAKGEHDYETPGTEFGKDVATVVTKFLNAGTGQEMTFKTDTDFAIKGPSGDDAREAELEKKLAEQTALFNQETMARMQEELNVARAKVEFLDAKVERRESQIDTMHEDAKKAAKKCTEDLATAAAEKTVLQGQLDRKSEDYNERNREYVDVVKALEDVRELRDELLDERMRLLVSFNGFANKLKSIIETEDNVNLAPWGSDSSGKPQIPTTGLIIEPDAADRYPTPIIMHSYNLCISALEALRTHRV